MRIAILLPGQPRFNGDLQNFLKNLKGYDQADWFVYLTNSSTRDALKIRTHSDIPQVHEEWINYDIEWATSKIIQNLPNNNYLKKFEISDVHIHQWPYVRDSQERVRTENIFNMYYNIYKVNQLRVNYEQDNNFKYDAVIRTRPDLGLVSEVNIKDYDLNSIIMPNDKWHGIDQTSNDQFAFGTSDAMSIYSDVMNHLEKYEKQLKDFGPETVLGHHLKSNNISYIRGNFNTSIRSLPLDGNWI